MLAKLQFLKSQGHRPKCFFHKWQARESLDGHGESTVNFEKLDKPLSLTGNDSSRRLLKTRSCSGGTPGQLGHKSSEEFKRSCLDIMTCQHGPKKKKPQNLDIFWLGG